VVQSRREGFNILEEFKDRWPDYSCVPWNPDLFIQVYEFRVET
jgi:hypothetical protein